MGSPGHTADGDASVVVGLVEEALRPRWVWWSSETAAPFIRTGVRIATCWDISAVHRLLFGGWRADPGRVWARLHHLALETVPTMAPPDLFSYAENDGDGEDPVQPDGHLRPEWASGGWARTSGRVLRWAELAAQVAALQQASLAELGDRPRAGALARSESTAELLCAELSAGGLPMDRAAPKGSSLGSWAAPAHGRRGGRPARSNVTPRCFAMLQPLTTSTCAARDRCARCLPGPGSIFLIHGHGG